MNDLQLKVLRYYRKLIEQGFSVGRAEELTLEVFDISLVSLRRLVEITSSWQKDSALPPLTSAR